MRRSGEYEIRRRVRIPTPVTIPDLATVDDWLERAEREQERALRRQRWTTRLIGGVVIAAIAVACAAATWAGLETLEVHASEVRR